ncbi:TonB-dependent receptor [Ottowia sp.]|uniref:TonB-dependent receptor n=1 Tax=Ottowia sp. TaxID=1898956 RepID=UPI003A894DF9
MIPDRPAAFRWRTTALATLALTAQAATAQPTATPDPDALPDVTVQGHQLFQPRPDANATDAKLGATVLDMRPSGASRAATADSARLLEAVPGASTQGAGGVSSLPVLRGLGDERLRLLVDGMDLAAACPNHMNPALSYIDPSQVDLMTVYAGVTPVSVGGDSIGGTVQVESAPPRFAAPGQPMLLEGSASTSYRSNGDGFSVGGSAMFATEQLNLHYEGAWARADNYHAAQSFKPEAAGSELGAPIPGDEVASSAFRSQNHKLGAAWRQGMHLWQLDVGWQDIPHEGFPNQRMDMTDNRSTQLNARYTGQWSWGDLKLRAFHQRVRHRMDMGEDRYSYGSGMPMRSNASTTGASAQANWLTSERDTVRLGIEAQRYKLYDWWPPAGSSGVMTPNHFWNVDNGQRHRADAFAEWERRWNPQWMTLAGLRYTRVMTNAGPVQGYSSLPTWADDAAAFNALERRRTDHHWDLAAIARYTPSAGQRYEAGFARKTRSPSLYERYPWSTNTMAAGMNNFVGDGNGYLGNPSLEPETAYTLSLGGQWHDPQDADAWGLNASAYYTRVRHYIDAIRCSASRCKSGNNDASDQFVLLQYANQTAQLYGFDVSGHWRAARSEQLGSLTLGGALNWLRGKNRSTGSGLYNTMPPNLKLSLTHGMRLGNGQWSTTLEWQGVQAKKRVSQVRNETRTPGYALFNLRASYEVNDVRIDLGVENLFDKFYAQPLGGAYVGQGSTMMLNTVPWGVPVPGPGRSFYAGVNIKF